jgi:hypothetical protein
LIAVIVKKRAECSMLEWGVKSDGSRSASRQVLRSRIRPEDPLLYVQESVSIRVPRRSVVSAGVIRIETVEKFPAIR